MDLYLGWDCTFQTCLQAGVGCEVFVVIDWSLWNMILGT